MKNKKKTLKKKDIVTKKSISKSSSEKKLPSTKMTKFSKSYNAFHSANYRRRKRGLEPFTWEEYNSQKTATDSAGRFHPIKHSTLAKAEKMFGKEIFTTKKICLKCSKKKILADFSMRFSQKTILNVCKSCEQNRQKKYWKD